MTTEPPQGLKANLKRTFTNVIDRDLFYEADLFQKELAAERASLEAAKAEEDEDVAEMQKGIWQASQATDLRSRKPSIGNSTSSTAGRACSLA